MYCSNCGNKINQIYSASWEYHNECTTCETIISTSCGDAMGGSKDVRETRSKEEWLKTTAGERYSKQQMDKVTHGMFELLCDTYNLKSGDISPGDALAFDSIVKRFIDNNR